MTHKQTLIFSLFSAIVCVVSAIIVLAFGSVIDDFSINRNVSVAGILLLCAVWIVASSIYLFRYYKDMSEAFDRRKDGSIRRRRVPTPRSNTGRGSGSTTAGIPERKHPSGRVERRDETSGGIGNDSDIIPRIDRLS